MRPLFCSPGGKFLSTPSARRATYTVINEMEVFLYFYPRPPRGGRRAGVLIRQAGQAYFYPRPPRGGRHGPFQELLIVPAFLSTPSARRATIRGRCGRDKFIISIHALREEGDRALVRLSGR